MKVHISAFVFFGLSLIRTRVHGIAIRVLVRTYVRTYVLEYGGKSWGRKPTRIRGSPEFAVPEWFPRVRSVRGAAEGAAVSQVMQMQEFREPP